MEKIKTVRRQKEKKPLSTQQRTYTKIQPKNETVNTALTKLRKKVGCLTSLYAFNITLEFVVVPKTRCEEEIK